MPIVLRSLMRDRVLHLLLLLGVILLPLADYRWPQLPAAIDWHTIITLSGLMMLTKGLELSGYFDVLGARLAQGFQHERTLALFMVCAAARALDLSDQRCGAVYHGAAHAHAA